MFSLFKISDGYKNPFGVQKFLLRLIGIQMNAEETKLYKLYRFVLPFLVISYSVIELIELLSQFDDFDVVTNIALHLIGFATGIAKMFLLSYNRQKLRNVFEILEKGILSMTRCSHEKELILNCILQTNKQTVYCLVPLYLVFMASALITLLKRIIEGDGFNWNLPFTQFTIINTKSSPNYEFLWLQQTVAFIVATGAYLTAEILVATVLAHLCVQCKIISYRIRGIGLLEKNTGSQRLRKKFKQIVIRHINIYDLTEKIQEVFGMIVFASFTSDTLIICFSAFHASLYPLNDLQCLRDFGIAISIAMKTLTVCYWGNEVSVESQSVAEACFECNFEDTSISLQKGLRLMMQRSQKPILITAVKFAPISLNTFIWIMKTSYSYFTVLQSRSI